MSKRTSMSDGLKNDVMTEFSSQASSSINPEFIALDQYGPRDKKKDIKLNAYELDLITRAAKTVPVTAAAFIRVAVLDAAREILNENNGSDTAKALF